MRQFRIRTIINYRLIATMLVVAALLVFVVPMYMSKSAQMSTGGYPYADARHCRPNEKDCKYENDPWGFFKRQCTSFVAWKMRTANGVDFFNGMKGGWFGNANNWGPNAERIGYIVNKTPAVGSIAWWINSNGGHVAWVSRVDVTGVYVEEYNDDFNGNYRTGPIRSEPNGYIHIKDLSDSGTSGVYLNGANGILAINRNGASGTTEMHIIDGTNVKRFVAQVPTALHRTTDDNWDFDVADYNRDGVLDLYAIKRNGSNNRTEIHIVDGANPGRFLAQFSTALHTTDANWDFAVADYNRDGTPDIYAINRRDTGSNSTAIHIINGANPHQFIQQSATGLNATNENWDFSLADYNRDGNLDVYAINRQDTGSNSTAVHVLNGNNLNQFLLQTGTVLHKTDANWAFK